MQSQLVQIINRLQQAKTDNPNGFDHIRGSFSGKGVASGSTNARAAGSGAISLQYPEEPGGGAVGGHAPQARGDLEQLTRLSIELFGSAFGVPSDILFSGAGRPLLPTPHLHV